MVFRKVYLVGEQLLEVVVVHMLFDIVEDVLDGFLGASRIEHTFGE
jgi:hypothetical protein